MRAAKATDENLTSENWEYIMDVVDKVGSEETGGKDVVASLIKRLAHRNANVQLYTLEVSVDNGFYSSAHPPDDHIACERFKPELRIKDTSRTRVESLYRCLVTTCERPEHTSAGEGQDTGVYVRMGGDVQVGPGFGNHERAILQTQDPKPESTPTVGSI